MTDILEREVNIRKLRVLLSYVCTKHFAFIRNLPCGYAAFMRMKITMRIMELDSHSVLQS